MFDLGPMEIDADLIYLEPRTELWDFLKLLEVVLKLRGHLYNDTIVMDVVRSFGCFVAIA